MQGNELVGSVRGRQDGSTATSPDRCLQVRLTDAFRFVVVGAPSYLERHGAPRHPEDLLRHECFTIRIPSGGALYAWELERGRRSWRVPVRGSVVTNDRRLTQALVEQGLGALKRLHRCCIHSW